MDFINFLTDDWKKIPQNYRYLILAGGFLIFNSWLVDHWGTLTLKPYTYLGIDIRSGGYNIGLTFIFIALALLVFKQFSSFGKVIWYRHRYPIEKLDTNFYLVWFDGRLMLFDDTSRLKKYYHVYPWETAQDLLFVGRGFEVLTHFLPNKIIEFPVNFEGKILKLKDFQDGGSICTR